MEAEYINKTMNRKSAYSVARAIAEDIRTEMLLAKIQALIELRKKLHYDSCELRRLDGPQESRERAWQKRENCEAELKHLFFELVCLGVQVKPEIQ